LGLIYPDGLRPNRPKCWNDGWTPTTLPGHCATAECAAGLPRTPSDNRSPEEVDFGQCKMVCQISLQAPVAMCNAAAGGGWDTRRTTPQRWFVHMDLQMNTGGQLSCPSCGRKYAALYFRPRTTCPHCRANVKTDLRAIGILETVIGVPLFWGAAVLLRTYLNDATGMLSYGLLLLPTLAIHFFVVRRFVTARLVD
jgi:hypothetical protein